MKLTRDKQLNALREAAFKKVVLPRSIAEKYEVIFKDGNCQFIPKGNTK
jgi:hypothetical protein